MSRSRYGGSPRSRRRRGTGTSERETTLEWVLVRQRSFNEVIKNKSDLFGKGTFAGK